MEKRSIYLSGPMDETSDLDLSWRHLVQLNLMDNFKCNIPMYLDDESSIKERWTREYFLLDKSDIVLVNLDYPQDHFFLGTFFEIGRAYLQNKIIIIVSSQKWVQENDTIQMHATRILDTLEDALDYLKAYYV